MEQQNRRGQAAIREEGRQAEGEVRQGNNTPPKGREEVILFVILRQKNAPTCHPQDIVAYRTKGKVDSESAATADDDEDEDDEEEEEDDDEEDDE